MIVALDANIVIYLIEPNPVWTPIALARLEAIRAAGDEIAFCDAGRFECLIKPLARVTRPMWPRTGVFSKVPM